ncbi:uridine kinase [Bacillus sp. FJAT-27225]|uniref:uridine kinase family protein n=1 Tax=Bacillus sp. FJAT-27225 TaxID=1743144 RepID=UPI00080C33FE|nr:AAA family ATPase [Bacillus sp. FJAT-27225]OCA83125.1 uridine kinase [Bacillus sp. FJAT-27225]
MSIIGEIVDSVRSIPRKQSTLLLGIDGCGGSGKSTLAKKLQEDMPNVSIVHIDDFYFPTNEHINAPPVEKPIGADLDWRRVMKQLLQPLSENQEGYYQRYDWESDKLAEWHKVPVGGIVIIEGVYSTRKELADFYDYTIWVDCPRDIRLKRGLERDGEAARDRWVNNWMVAEDVYVEAHSPAERADLKISGTS